MKLENIYIFVEVEIKNQFGTKAKMGKACGKARQGVNKVLTNSGITCKKVEEFLNLLGYELVIKKRG